MDWRPPNQQENHYCGLRPSHCRHPRHSAMRAIMARAESFTDDGACPSAQLIDESAVAFEPAVFDHVCRPEGMC